MSASNWVHIHVDKILKETDKAFLCEIDGEEIWLPISQVADSGDYSEGDEDLSMSITSFLAIEKGINGEEQ